jgi:hypothetical protein
MSGPEIALAGKYMRQSLGKGGSAVIEFTDEEPARKCGDCQLCCKLLPVVELSKAAGERCKHQRAGKGCLVYHRTEQGFPSCCGYWSCRWQTDTAMAGMPRPDRCHYVVDVMLDSIHAKRNDGTIHEIPCLQVWVDPAFPNAHRAPELRAYLNRMAEQFQVIAIVRWSSSRAVVLFPPAFTGDDKWIERSGNIAPRTALDRAVIANHHALQAKRGEAPDVMGKPTLAPDLTEAVKAASATDKGRKVRAEVRRIVRQMDPNITDEMAVVYEDTAIANLIETGELP